MTPLGMRPTLALQERGVKQRCRKDTRYRPARVMRGSLVILNSTFEKRTSRFPSSYKALIPSGYARQQSTGVSRQGQLTGLIVMTSPRGLQTRASSSIQIHGLRTCSSTPKRNVAASRTLLTLSQHHGTVIQQKGLPLAKTDDLRDRVLDAKCHVRKPEATPDLSRYPSFF